MPAHALTLRNQWSLKLAGRGVVESGNFALSGEAWALQRYAGRLTLDEKHLTFARPLSLTLTAFQQAGAAAARLPSDLIYLLLLRNPTLADGRSCFLPIMPTSELAAAATYLPATPLWIPVLIGNRLPGRDRLPWWTRPPKPHSEISRDGPRGIRASTTASTNTCPGRFYLEYWRNLIVRAESRLGPVGVVDPESEDTVTGGAKYWLLAAPESQAKHFGRRVGRPRAQADHQPIRVGRCQQR